MTTHGKNQGSNGRGPKPVGDLVSRLLDPVIERRAGMTTDLIAAWPDIVGERFCNVSRPEKFVWPAPTMANDDQDTFSPAMLVIACSGHHALFLQHDTTALIDRINGYFGFAAIDRVKIVQKQVVNQTKRGLQPLADVDGPSKERLSRLLEDVTDPDLRSALERMGRGVFSSGSSST
ncbi:MAG: DciA family protein [Pseudomonadota bacterium]